MLGVDRWGWTNNDQDLMPAVVSDQITEETYLSCQYVLYFVA